MLLDIIVNALVERDNRKRLKTEYERSVSKIKATIITATIRLEDRKNQNHYIEVIQGLSDYLETEFSQGLPADIMRMITEYYHKVAEIYFIEQSLKELGGNGSIEQMENQLDNFKAIKEAETKKQKSEEKGIEENEETIKFYADDKVYFVAGKALDDPERKKLKERSKNQNELEAQRLSLQTNLYMTQLINSQNYQVNNSIQQIYGSHFSLINSKYIPLFQYPHYYKT